MFNVKETCTVCNTEQMCQKVVLFNKDKEKRLEAWCEDCTKKIEEEIAIQKEEEMQEVYQDIIRSSYP